MRTEYFLFTHHTASILANLRTWCFEHSGNISCSLLVNTNHTDESWEGRNTCLWIYALNFFIEHSGEHWWEQNIFCSFTTPQAFWQSSAHGALSTLVTSVVLYSLTQATLKSPEKNETRVCGYIYIYIYIWKNSSFLLWELRNIWSSWQNSMFKPQATTRTGSATYHLALPFLMKRMLNLATLRRVVLGL